MFEKGEIIHYDFKEYNQSQYTVKGPHFAVVLYDNPGSGTIMVAPISSSYDENGKKKKLKSWHYELEDFVKYNLKHESYIKTDQIHSIDKPNIKLVNDKIPLDLDDCKELDMRLIEVFEMFQAFEYYAQQKYKQIREIYHGDENKKLLFDSLRGAVQENVFVPFEEGFKAIVSELIVEEEIKEQINNYLEKQKDKVSTNMLDTAVTFTENML